MAYYLSTANYPLSTANYASAAIQARIKQAKDPEEALRKAIKDFKNAAGNAKKIKDLDDAVADAIEKAGGKPHAAFVALGSSDVVILSEFPDETSTAKVTLAVQAARALTNVATRKLLTFSQLADAIQEARQKVKSDLFDALGKAMQ